VLVRNNGETTNLLARNKGTDLEFVALAPVLSGVPGTNRG
jgi:hypothetical protein